MEDITEEVVYMYNNHSCGKRILENEESEWYGYGMGERNRENFHENILV